MRKPTITVRKADETEYINARRYWSLSLPGADDCTYELQVKHRAPEDEFEFVRWDMGDATVLVTADEMQALVAAAVDHEPEETLSAALQEITMCHDEMSHHEVTVLAHLRATWDAFAMLFNPEINVF